MNGLYLKNPSELEWKEFPSITALADDEVKIKLIYGGICGSDISVYKGNMAHANYPVLPGHELVGTVVDAGANVREKVGQRVVVQPNSFCGECDYCKAGKTNICPYKMSLGINKDGGFIEEFIISSKYVLPVPDALSNERAVLIEPFSVIVHALKKVNITSDTSVAVIGCGTEGMLSIALVDYLGANITAVDVNPEKLKKVNDYYGAVETCLPEQAEEGTFDIVIEAAGAKQSFEQGVQILKPGGSMVVVGMAPTAEIPVVQMVRKELSIYGSIIYNFPDDFQTSIGYLLQDEFNAKPIISEIIPVKEYERAYAYATSGRYGKIILNFEEDINEEISF